MDPGIAASDPREAVRNSLFSGHFSGPTPDPGKEAQLSVLEQALHETLTQANVWEPRACLSHLGKDGFLVLGS